MASIRCTNEQGRQTAPFFLIFFSFLFFQCGGIVPGSKIKRRCCVYCFSPKKRDIGLVMKGSCLCGIVEFDVTGVKNIYQCHCSLCRKQGGSASNTGTVVPIENLEWIKGKENIKSWVKESGFRSDFCTNCGSPVPNPLRGLNYYWIPVGTLEDGQFKIVANLYMDSKAPWGVVAPTGGRFKTMPELTEFLALLVGNGHA